jgi:hypothetical protein
MPGTIGARHTTMGHESPIELWSPKLTTVSALLVLELTGLVANRQ